MCSCPDCGLDLQWTSGIFQQKGTLQSEDGYGKIDIRRD